jgi:hypothetical protein
MVDGRKKAITDLKSRDGCVIARMCVLHEVKGFPFGGLQKRS